jgi:glutamate racemase
MMNNRSDPIGVFDSGIGGLTVVRALMEELPSENIVYFGDTARVPYGVKSVETITRYATEITAFLLDKKVKALIVACNTMAAVAFQAIEILSPVPLLGVVEAGAKRAVLQTQNKRVGIIGTPTTIASNAYPNAISTYDPGIKVFSQSCPLFVPLVEEGWLDHQATRLTAEEYLGPLMTENIDTLVLACTHYPLLKPLLREVLGNRIQLVDSAETISKQTRELFGEKHLLNREGKPPEYRFYVTDAPERFREVGERFLGQALSKVTVVKW